MQRVQHLPKIKNLHNPQNDTNVINRGRQATFFAAGFFAAACSLSEPEPEPEREPEPEPEREPEPEPEREAESRAATPGPGAGGGRAPTAAPGCTANGPQRRTAPRAPAPPRARTAPPLC
jgi:hypothetical protein